MTNIQNTLSNAEKHLATLSDTALLDAEVLLSHVLSKPRSHFRAWPEKQLSEQESMQFQELFKKRQQGIPIAYITGQREFWSRDFKVTPEVLIPRPDTELLIELSLGLLANKTKARVLDLATGSGIIAVTLAAERPDLEIVATDFSLSALKIAQENADHHAIHTIQFIHSDWFFEIPKSRFDLIISNPPYIAENDPHLAEGDVRFEPEMALVAAEQGFKDIRIISQQARPYLKANATLLLEHGFDQQSEVQALFKSLSYINIIPHNDLSGNPRVTTGQWQ